MVELNLIPIKAVEFRKVALCRCGIKYRNKISERKLKEMLGYCPTNSRKVEINGKSYESLNQAALDCGFKTGVIKYALDHGKPSIKRRKDKKVFYVKEIK